jgi:hypothetical protein
MLYIEYDLYKNINRKLNIESLKIKSTVLVRNTTTRILVTSTQPANLGQITNFDACQTNARLSFLSCGFMGEENVR